MIPTQILLHNTTCPVLDTGFGPTVIRENSAVLTAHVLLITMNPMPWGSLLGPQTRGVRALSSACPA
jgi:hypothetical protein